MAGSENSSGLNLSVLREILNPALFKESEVILICQDQKIPTNRIILQMASPVFRKMFEVNMTEKSSGIVNIKDVDPEVMKMVIDYYENGTMIDVETVNHRELCNIIEKYDFQAIKFGISARIISQFTGVKLMKAYKLLKYYGTKENVESTASEIGKYLALEFDSQKVSKQSMPLTMCALDLSIMSVPDLIIRAKEFNRRIEVLPRSLSARREFAKTCVAVIEQSLESKEVCTELLQTLNYESFDIDFFKEELFGRKTKLTEDLLYSIIQVFLQDRGRQNYDFCYNCSGWQGGIQNLQGQTSTESKIIACLKTPKKA